MKNLFQASFLFSLLLTCLQLQGQGSFFAGLNGSYNATIVANQMNYGQKEMDYDGVTFNPSFGLEVGYDFNGGSLLSIGAGIVNGGQKYKDGYGNGDKLKKEIKLSYLAIPVTYKYLFGGKKSPHEGTKFFVALGAQFNLLQKAEVTHTVNGTNTTLETFANHIAGGGDPYNFNATEIAKLTVNGEPTNDKDLFESTDIQGILGIGLQSYFSENFSMSFEARAAGSLTDINATDWRLDGYKDEKRQDYNKSQNVSAGLRIGLYYNF